jgi:hypothetical protein
MEKIMLFRKLWVEVFADRAKGTGIITKQKDEGLLDGREDMTRQTERATEMTNGLSAILLTYDSSQRLAKAKRDSCGGWFGIGYQGTQGNHVSEEQTANSKA